MKFPECILTEELLAALEREPEQVMEEVRSGALSVDDAQWNFGVVFLGPPNGPDFAVDEQATARLREQIRVAGAPPGGA